MGRVEAVVPLADPGSRTFQVKVILPNPNGAIHSGMFARIQFQKGDRPGMLVPTSAVVQEGQLQGVYVVGQDSIARFRLIRTGATRPGGIEVLSGLSAGELVVLNGVERVQDGARIEKQ